MTVYSEANIYFSSSTDSVLTNVQFVRLLCKLVVTSAMNSLFSHSFPVSCISLLFFTVFSREDLKQFSILIYDSHPSLVNTGLIVFQLQMYIFIPEYATYIKI